MGVITLDQINRLIIMKQQDMMSSELLRAFIEDPMALHDKELSEAYMPEHRINDEDIKTLTTGSETGKITSENFEIFLSNPLKYRRHVRVYPVTIDYDLTAKQMIEHANKAIPKGLCNNSRLLQITFPYHEKVSKELVLLDMKRTATISHVRNCLNYFGLIAARVESLLAYSADYPEVQMRFRINALGSSWNCPQQPACDWSCATRQYPSISTSYGTRICELVKVSAQYDDDGNYRYEEEFNENCRFLAEKKSELG